MRTVLMSSIGLALVAAPAMAAERTGYMAIAAGNLKKAEATLSTARQTGNATPEVLLNLAAVYQQTGRTAEARSLYAAVLDSPDVQMDLASGATAGSHQVAQRGLNRLTPLAIATR
ncbi:tetratricopeptide repeat protein [Sphingomonas sp. SORGH_AS_0438]|nr:tetratricopeptide repeat protein [Sphingomonas sp. SORGH_AS_0438]MDR6125710.1 Flp pilus assembly protein TadD [Sphingomonas sp. SORGH_AS_0438]